MSAGSLPRTRMSGKARTALFAVLGICFMSGLGWASIPLYRMFCAATGLNGTTQRGLVAPGAVSQQIRIDFDTNVAPGMKWKFEPENPSDTVDIGARDMAFFKATNLSDHPITGTATFNVTPSQAGKYFTKIQCFCFTEQTLAAGQEVRMPVTYYVDPDILKDDEAKRVTQITLSYSFHEVREANAKSEANALDRTAPAR